jgi:hypothetical protein
MPRQLFRQFHMRSAQGYALSVQQQNAAVDRHKLLFHVMHGSGDFDDPERYHSHVRGARSGQIWVVSHCQRQSVHLEYCGHPRAILFPFCSRTFPTARRREYGFDTGLFYRSVPIATNIL